MINNRSPLKQLDALLTGLEDEVLRFGQSGGHLVDGSDAVEEIEKIRFGIESMIRSLTSGSERQTKLLRSAGDSTPDNKASVKKAIQRMSLWRGSDQRGYSGMGVRMAFSGESPERLGESTPKWMRRPQKDDLNDDKNKDS